MNSSCCLTGALAVLVLALVSLPANAQVSISLDIAPPPLVVETQPACPDDGYIWTPGYWSYDDNAGEYYWVPGAWVQPPEVGLYWTPAYWGWNNGAYAFYPGYWGPTVGFYGGVNYGHGYWGNGYGGGRWDNGHFAYNSAANNVQGGRVHNTYADKSMYRPRTDRTSFNGGQGGIQAQPTPQQQQVANRVPATAQQQSHFQMAAQTHTHPVKVNAHNMAANASAAATAQNQAAPAAAQAQPHQNGPLNDWSNPAQKPAAAPAVNKPDAALTGGDTEAQQKEHAAAASNQAKQDEKPHVAEPPAQNKPEPVANHEVKMDTQPHVAEQPAPQVHAQQGPGAEPSVTHDTHATAPDVHAQAAPAPHIEAKPQGPAAGAKPEAKADGPGKPGDQPGGH